MIFITVLSVFAAVAWAMAQQPSRGVSAGQRRVLEARQAAQQRGQAAALRPVQASRAGVAFPSGCEELSKLKVVQLKQRCRERGLPVSGIKALLVERLLGDSQEGKEKEVQDKAEVEEEEDPAAARLRYNSIALSFYDDLQTERITRNWPPEMAKSFRELKAKADEELNMRLFELLN